MPHAPSIVLTDFATFGDFLKYLRRRAKMTQSELALACSYDTSHLSRLESNQRLPDQATLLALFVPALGLQDEPELVERLLALAAAARQEEASSDVGTATPTPRHNLPVPSTPFVGRSDELARIGELLDDPTCRLLTLTGPGGIGKTRLALQAAAGQFGKFRNGVFFVSLVGVSSPDFLVSTVADAVGFSFYSGSMTVSGKDAPTDDPKTQLLNYLGAKSVLLLMDNFEHLLDGVNLLPDVLSCAPAVKILATSREPLALQDEWNFSVGGLDVPNGDPTRPLEGYSAVQLFAQRVRRVQVRFSLPDNADAVVRICHGVSGMPLGIELAAGLLGAIPIAEIADQIEHNVDLLETSLRDVPQRHRSLRIMFEHSWSLLSQRERAALMKLSVFRGGFRREAAEYVTEAPFQVLLALVHKSLVWLNPSGRYHIHELLRQFAAEKLKAIPDECDAAQNRHCSYFAGFVQQRADLLERRADMVAIQEIQADVENVRVAWSRAVVETKSAEVSLLVFGLHFFYWFQGWFEEALESFKRAGSALSNESLDDAGKLALGQVLIRQAIYLSELRRSSWPDIEALSKNGLSIFEALNAQNDMGWAFRAIGVCEISQHRLAQGRDFFEKAVDTFRAVGATAQMIDSLLLLGDVTWEEGGVEETINMYRNALSTAKELGSSIYVAFALARLCNICWSMGKYSEARDYHQENVVLLRKTGSRRLVGAALGDFFNVAWLQGNFLEARQLAQESLEIFTELGYKSGIGCAYGELGIAEIGLGNHAAAIKLMHEAIAIFKEINDRDQEALWLNNLSGAHCLMGDYAEARRLGKESVAILRASGPRLWLGLILDTLGHASLGLGQYQEAKNYFVEGLTIDREMKVTSAALSCIGGLAKIRGAEGQAEAALELLGLVLGHPATAPDVMGYMKPLLAEFESELPPEVFAAGLERGKSLDLETVIADLLRQYCDEA